MTRKGSPASVLAFELAKTRFHFSSLKHSYKTFASINRVSFENISKSWDEVGTSIMNFRTVEPDYTLLECRLEQIGIDQSEVKKILFTIRQLISKSRSALYANVNPVGLHFDKKLGTIGELVAYLYSKDIEHADCIFHKLVLDNPNVPRHGMDLLTIVFGDDEDSVRFWEAKGTLADFANQCRKIVEWFTDAESYERISMVIEAAKIDWEEKFEREKFDRASIALSRFQAEAKNFRYTGCIVYDSDSPPTESNIQRFDEVADDMAKKHLIIVEVEELRDIVEEVYEKTCRM